VRRVACVRAHIVIKSGGDDDADGDDD
jgi:hypothetical protein